MPALGGLDQIPHCLFSSIPFIYTNGYPTLFRVAPETSFAVMDVLAGQTPRCFDRPIGP